MKQFRDAVTFRNFVVMNLMKGPCYAIFQKKDGTIRHMLCTLHNQLIPQTTPVDPTASKTYKKRTDAVLAVYDLEKKEWRSFIMDNVKFFGELDTIDDKMKKMLKETYKDD